MNKTGTAEALTVVAIWIFLSTTAPLSASQNTSANAATDEQGSSGNALAIPSEWYCPWCGSDPEMDPWRHRSGPGIKEYQYSPGYGGGPMMTRRGPQMGQQYWRERIYDPGRDLSPLTEEESKKLLQRFVLPAEDASLSGLRDTGDVFEADVLDRDGKVLGTVQVDKDTGWIRSLE